jgi:hypothetical protein
MIFESQAEKDAFEFMYELASDETSRRGCNDLEEKDRKKFVGLTVPTDDNGKIVQSKISMDFDVLHWLKLQVKGANK